MTNIKELEGLVKLDYQVQDYIGIPNKVLLAARQTGRGRDLYRKTLERYLDLDTLKIPENPRVLDLGCSYAKEAFVQSGYLGRKVYGADSSKVDFIGIDIDEGALESARREYSEMDFDQNYMVIPKKNYHFIHGDATKLEEFVEGNFDVIFASHPETLHREEVWRQIFQKAKLKHNPNGIIVGTFYMDKEMEKMIEAITPEYKTIVATQNIHSEIVDSRSKLHPHKYILIGQKK